jgi:hypothetical protein
LPATLGFAEEVDPARVLPPGRPQALPAGRLRADVKLVIVV